VDGFKGLQPTGATGSYPRVRLPSMPELHVPARVEPTPSTSSRTDPFPFSRTEPIPSTSKADPVELSVPRMLEGLPHSLRLRSSSSLLRRPRTVSPSVLETLKTLVARSKELSPVVSSSSTTPFNAITMDLHPKPPTGLVSNPELARLAFLSNFPNSTFSMSEASRLPISEEVPTLHRFEISHQVEVDTTSLQNDSNTEREISSVINPALLEPKIELVELPSPTSPSDD
jgi:hypothetical protein